MKLYKTTQGIIIQCDDKVYLSQEKDWDYCVNQDNLHEVIETEIQTLNEILWDYEGIHAPIGQICVTKYRCGEPSVSSAY